MTDRQKQFEKALNDFPEPVRKILQTIPQQAGRLSASQCIELMTHLGIDREELMTRLLPLAKSYALVPVSQFQVGAVAMADSRSNDGRFNLFLGANLEFSEAPCGHCRQFLYEFEKNADLIMITPHGKNLPYRRTALSDLLPEAFGPLDLGNHSGLMSPEPPDRKLRLETADKDPTIARALSAAQKSYAPYTQNVAGCALQTQTGEIFSGRSAECAAYNPSLTALQSAVVALNVDALEQQPSIQRVVLVEKPTAVSQRRSTELFLGSWAPRIELEYFEL
jgi:cytidine deaminase